jgi:hypothetical protein
MDYRIQASQPKNNVDICAEDEKLSEAIETIFPMMTEEALIIWNTIYIPLNYKYDVSCMIEDILCMLKAIRENPNHGVLRISWPSNSFACDWKLVWDQGILIISSVWRTVLGHTENLLNKANKIKVNLLEFLYEWKMLLEVLIYNLEQSGYNQDNLKDMNELYNGFNHIEKYGLLYLSS